MKSHNGQWFVPHLDYAGPFDQLDDAMVFVEKHTKDEVAQKRKHHLGSPPTNGLNESKHETTI
jgi:hypothetical protein